MIAGEFFRRADVAQRSFAFKVSATIVVALAAAGLFLTYWLVMTSPEDGLSRLESIRAFEAEMADEARREAAERSREEGVPLVEGEVAPDTAIDEGRRALENVLRGRSDPTGVASGLAIGAGLAVVVIWMGLGLTYLGLAIGTVLLISFMWLSVLALDHRLNPFQISISPRLLATLHLLTTAILGIAILTASFTALLQAARAVMSPGNAVTAVAKNVLAEAVRLRLSVVFIVLLIFGLSTLPGLLDAQEELRYRVQSFLQYGTSGSFWIVALLTVFFSTATVAFEQRDKTIWQTVTKPVAAWQYLLGKWLGVVTLNAVLLAVCGSGVFLFTEYLRGQPAIGERQAFIPASEASVITSDRLILETQILAARVSVQPSMPFPRNDPEFVRSALEFIEMQRRSDPSFAATPEAEARVVGELYETTMTTYFSIDPGQSQRFVFRGLGGAKSSGSPISLRFRADAGSNSPDEFFYITFGFPHVGQTQVREISPGFSQTLPPLSPSVINDAGELVLDVWNGDVEQMRLGTPRAISFARRGGMEVSYEAGSYRANFARVMGVLWLKLAFVAMVGVLAATFLSFPVAAMVTLGTFIAAEMSTFMLNAIELYGTTDAEGNTQWHKVITVGIAGPIARAFQVYAELRPTQRLVDGQLLSWSSVAAGLGVIAAWTGVLYALAVLAFRRRELAIYSGR
ncbi:MAG: hypothetical protein EA378_09745 [Phycisphaerales bacterium]|nr:MAG: hypothetical protein EA378_09745 [Phycisphaerales bacterium]